MSPRQQTSSKRSRRRTAVRLTADEVRRFTEAQRVLLSPFAHTGGAAWCLAANAALRALLGGDRAAFYLPAAGGARAVTAHAQPATCHAPAADAGPPVTFVPDRAAHAPVAPGAASVPIVIASEEFAPSQLTPYPNSVAPLTTSVALFPRMGALGAFSREELVAPFREMYYGSSYYQDYLVSIRALDCLALAVPQRGRGADMPDAAVDAPTFATTAQLLCYHDTWGGPRFGAHELALLRLLYPAFRAGVEGWWALGRHIATLSETVDALGLALAIVDGSGRELHRTPALGAIYAVDTHATTLMEIVQRLGRASATRAHDSRPGLRRGRADLELVEPSIGAIPVVRTPLCRYRIRAVALAGVAAVAQGASGACPATAVLVERLPHDEAADPSPGLMDTGGRAYVPDVSAVRALGDRLGLTPAQARVAWLVADGLGNGAIADSLGLSAHTVRHHVEHACARLGIAGRGSLAARVHRVLSRGRPE